MNPPVLPASVHPVERWTRPRTRHFSLDDRNVAIQGAITSMLCYMKPLNYTPPQNLCGLISKIKVKTTKQSSHFTRAFYKDKLLGNNVMFVKNVMESDLDLQICGHAIFFI